MVATSTQLLPDNHLHRIMPFNRFVATFKIAFLPLGVELNACRNNQFRPALCEQVRAGLCGRLDAMNWNREPGRTGGYTQS